MIKTGILLPAILPEAMSQSWLPRCVTDETVRNDRKTLCKNLMSTLQHLSTLSDHSKCKKNLDKISSISNACSSSPKNIVQIVEYTTTLQTLNKKYADKILTALPFFAKLMSNVSLHPNLSKFIRAFQKRYEMQSVPLMEALNPEIGIGYGDSICPHANLLLQGLVYTNKGNHSQKTIILSELEKILKRKRDNALNEIIRLDDNDVSALESQISRLPSSFSAVFDFIDSLDGEAVISELHFSGISAACLPGRFTLGDKSIDQMVSKIARYEEKAYREDGIVAEINLLPTYRSGNVNQRSQFRKYRICPFVSGNKNDIPLSNLYVSVKNGKVVLTKGKYGKKVYPRLSSAHNHYAQTDVLYQFLGDVQNQDNLTTMMFSWGRLRSMYTHFPRVYYNDIIISLKEWNVENKRFLEGKIISLEKIKFGWMSRIYHAILNLYPETTNWQ